MTHSIRSNTAVDRIAYALMRDEGAEAANSEAVATTIQNDFNQRIEASSSEFIARQTEVAQMATELIAEVGAITPYQASAEHIALLQGRLVNLKEKKEELLQGLRTKEALLKEQNLIKRSLTNNLHEGKLALRALDAYSGSEQRVKEVGTKYVSSVAKEHGKRGK